MQVWVRRDKLVPQTSTLHRAVGLLLFLCVTADHGSLGGIPAALITRVLTQEREPNCGSLQDGILWKM